MPKNNLLANRSHFKPRAPEPTLPFTELWRMRSRFSALSRRLAMKWSGQWSDFWIVLLLFFLLDAAKTSPQTQNICPLFVCRMKRNMKWAETLQTFRKQLTVLTEIYWDLRSKVSVSCRTMIWYYFEDWFRLMSLMLIVCEASYKCYR